MGYQAIDSLFYVEDYAALCQTRINRTAVQHRLQKTTRTVVRHRLPKINRTAIRHRLPKTTRTAVWHRLPTSELSTFD